MTTTTESAGWLIDRPETAGDRIKLLRLEFGLSADAAASACGIDGQSWRNYEQGRHDMKVSAAERIVRRFEGDEGQQRQLLGWLLLGGEKPRRPEPPSPFDAPVTVRKGPRRNAHAVRATRRNSVYCSVPGVILAA